MGKILEKDIHEFYTFLKAQNDMDISSDMAKEIVHYLREMYKKYEYELKKEYEEIPIEVINEFYEWLQEKIGLTEDQSFQIIFYLQEDLGIIPTHYEQCNSCKCLYDSDWGGGCYTGHNNDEVPDGCYCSDCLPDDYWDDDCEENEDE